MAHFEEQLKEYNTTRGTSIARDEANVEFNATTKPYNTKKEGAVSPVRQFVTDEDGEVLPEGQTRVLGETVGEPTSMDEWTDVGQPVQEDVNPPSTRIDEADEKPQTDPMYLNSGREDTIANLQYAKTEIAHQVQVEEASFADKMSAGAKTWKSTYLSSMVNWVETDMPYLWGESEEFMSKNNDERVDAILSDNELPSKYRWNISQAKNGAHELALVNEAIKMNKMDKAINDNLNNYGSFLTERNVAGGVTGLLGDIDTPLMLFSFGMSKLAKLEMVVNNSWKFGGSSMGIGEKGLIKSANGRNVDTFTAGTDFGRMEWNFKQTNVTRPHHPINKYGTPSVVVSGHISAGTAAYIKDPDVSGAEASIFSTIGAVVDGLVAYRSAKDIANHIQPAVKTASKAPDNDTLLLSHKSVSNEFGYSMRKQLTNITKELPAPKVDVEDATTTGTGRETKLSAEEANFARLLEDMDDVTSAGNPTARANRAIAQLEEIGYLKAPEVPEEIPKDIETDRVTAKELGEDGKPTVQALEAQKRIDDFESRKTEQNKERLAEHNKEQFEAIKDSIRDFFKKPNRRGFTGLNKVMDKLNNMKGKNPILDEMMAQINDFKALGNGIVPLNFKQFIKDIGIAVKNGEYDALKTKEQVKGVVTDLFDSGYLTARENKALQKALETGDIGDVDVNLKFKVNKDSTLTPIQKNTKKEDTSKFGKLKIPIILIGLGSSSMLMADDGTAIDIGGIASVFVLGFLTVAFALPIAKNMYKRIGQTNKTIENGKNARPFLKVAQDGVEEAQISLVSTLKPLMSDPSLEVRGLVQKLYYDVFDGAENTIERAKAMYYRAWSLPLLDAGTVQYKSWLVEQKISKVRSIMDTSVNWRNRFEAQATEYIEYGMHQESKALKEYTDHIQRVKKEIWAKGKESGAKGFTDSAKLGDDYMPRVVHGTLSQLLLSIDDATYKQVVKQFSETMGGGAKGLIKAQQYLDAIKLSNTTTHKIGSVKDLQSYFDKKGIKGVTAEEMASEFGIRDHQWGRTKHRIEIDKQKFGELKINTMDGQEITMTIDDFFESSAVSIMQKYVNQASGHISLAEAGMDIDQAMKIAGKARGENSKTIINDLQNIVGNPTLDEGAMVTQVLRDVSNYTVATKMVTSVISLAFEGMLLLSQMNKSGFNQMMNEVAKTLSGGNAKNSALAQSIMDMTGGGQHMKGLSYGSYRHLDELNMMDAGYRSGKVGKMFSRSGEFFRDAVLTPLIYSSDIMSRINMVNKAQEIYDLAHGAKIPAYRMKAAGITQSFLDKMKNRLKVNKNGDLAPIDTKDWTPSEIAQFKKVIDNLTRKTIQETTMGATGAWTRQTDAGMATSMLLKFPMEAFSQHGLFNAKGMMHGDPRAYANTFFAFAGGYVSALIRSEALGRDYSEEELMIFALKSMPLNMMGIWDGITNPAMTDVMAIEENFNKVSQIINTGN